MRQDEFLSQGVLQTDTVFLFRRNTAVPGVYFVHEFNMDVHEWTFPRGRERKSVMTCKHQREDRLSSESAHGYESPSKLILLNALCVA